MLLDTGATTNVIDMKTYSNLISKPKLEKYSGRAFGYGSKVPISVVGKFKAQITSNNLTITREFLVVDSAKTCILGEEACQYLGLVVILNQIKATDIFERFDKVFTKRIGKYKGAQMRIHINYDIKPIKEKLRRVCFNQREKVEIEINRLEKEGIIEKTPFNEATTWISPIVVVNKPNGDVRICNDSKASNTAIAVERFLMVTPEDIRYKLEGAKYLSKLDMNRAYLQFEIHPDDRHITTFTTHIGLFRYTRMFFSLKSASEWFQRVIKELLEHIPNSINVSDDILIFGRTQEEHDEALIQVLLVLEKAGLTLNPDKCEFNKEKIKFYGMIFSGEGVSPTDERVKAFREASPPKTANEVKSILSLVKFSAGFIKDLASISEPLRELIKSSSKFEWLPKRQEALD